MILAVVVTYAPDLEILQKVLAALRSQVASIIAVDNGSSDIEGVRRIVESLGGRFVPLFDNAGIAAAHNRGIALAIEAGATDVLLMDQDSILEPGTVKVLAATRQRLIDDDVQVGSVGPVYRSSHDGQLAPVWRAEGRKLVRVDPDKASGEWIEADFVIASGSLLSVAVLGTVGMMDEPLFIDLVDLEWGFRASAMGYRHFVCRNARMAHSLGEGRLHFLRRKVTRHAPIRNYYWVRNSLVLSRRSYVRFPWKRYFLVYVPRFLVFYSLFADSRLKRLRLMLAGIADAFRGRSGSFDRR